MYSFLLFAPLHPFSVSVFVSVSVFAFRYSEDCFVLDERMRRQENLRRLRNGRRNPGAIAARGKRPAKVRVSRKDRFSMWNNSKISGAGSSCTVELSAFNA